MNQALKTERKRKHISIKIDQELGASLWVQRDKETDPDLINLSVFPSLLWKARACNLPQTSSKKIAEVVKARIEKLIY